MHLPLPPSPQPIQAISPSLYEAMRHCRARAVWARFGPRQVIPDVPNAVLGTSFHRVMEAAAERRLPPHSQVEARGLFDAEAQRIFEGAHPLLRNKYPTKAHLPNYFLQRERVALAALRLSSSIPPVPPGVAAPASQPASPAWAGSPAEQLLSSQDGQLRGKIDFLNVAAHEVVDYKAGIVFQGSASEVSDRERRQLSFYAYLAQERGVMVQKGTIIRSNGQAASIQISPQDALSVAQDARNTLAEYNRAVGSGSTFHDLGQPSKEACWFCPCIPFCEKFWEFRKPDWAEFQGFGWHLQGLISQASESDLQGLRVLTMTLSNCTGTSIPDGAAVTIEQIPIPWITPNPETAPNQGQVVRVVHARRPDEANSQLFRADKALSTVWQLSVQ